MDSRINQRGQIWNFDLFKSYKIKLYKLHGSVNWRRDGNFVYRVPRKQTHKQNAIIYPGYKDTPKEEPFKSLHSAFSEELNSTDLLIAIGFSFRDVTLNKIILDALDTNKKLRILIWNPNLPEHPFPKNRTINYAKYFDENSLKELEEKHLDQIKSSINKGTSLQIVGLKP